MEKKIISRKEFFKDSSKIVIGAAAGAAGLNLLLNNKAYADEKNSKSSSWPYPYVALDPEEARDAAHTAYYNGKFCAAGVLTGIVQLLRREIGDPWTGFPTEVMLFGKGGGVGWGSLCGTLNGAGALISLVVESKPSSALITELWGWYTTEALPTDAANSAVYSDVHYDGEMAQSVSGSPLCHPSVSQWCAAANKKVSSPERLERCGRLAGDIAAKTVSLLNEYFADNFTATYADSDQNTTCMSCHGPSVLDNVSTHMECVSCHTTAHHITATPSIVAKDYNLSKAYPNPFHNETTIKFSIPKSEKVRFEIYNIKGQLIYSLIDSDLMNAGTYKVTWKGLDNSGNQVPNGIYLARLTTGNYMKTIRIVMSK